MKPHSTFLSLVPMAAALTAALAAPLPGAAAVPHRHAGARAPDHAHAVFGKAQASPQVRRLADWVLSSGDHHGRPFAIIDKPHARLYVFHGNGRLKGSSPVLLGLAHGDDSAPGIGDKPLAQIKPEERTTPAGRFVGEHGTNAHGVHVIWVDYDAAVSMHPVITSNPKEQRQHRLDTPTIADNRISYGCVNVPKPFFAHVVLKTLTEPKPMIYVVPETRPLEQQFAGLSRVSRESPGSHLPHSAQMIARGGD